MRARYAHAMERLYLACVGISGLALVVITLIIPYGVFMRYAMNSAASWPEPLAVLLMVLFSFVGGAAVYRANLHMAVVALLEAVNEKTRKAMLALVDLCMLATALFMLGYGAHLVAVFWIDIPLEAVMLKISDGVDNFSLLAIPFFVLAGAIMAEGGMARRLVNLARVFVGWIRGGLALVNIVASTLFGCISGSSVA